MIQKAQFVLCHDPATGDWDIYNAKGLFLSTTAAVFLLSDTSLLTFPLNGYWSPLYKGYRSIVFYPLQKGPGSKLWPELTASPEFHTYLNDPDTRPSTLCYASGKIITLPFKIRDFVNTPHHVLVSVDGKQGVYDCAQHQYITPPQWSSIEPYLNCFLICQKEDSSKILMGLDGHEYGPLPYFIRRSKEGYYTGEYDTARISYYYTKQKALVPEAKIVSGNQALLSYTTGDRKYYLQHNPEHAVTSAGEKHYYLTDFNLLPLLDPKDNPDSIIYEIGDGLYAISRSKTFTYKGTICKQSDQYISAIYDGYKHAIVARQDSLHCRISRNEKTIGPSYTAYTIETVHKIIYIGLQRDTISVFTKALPEFNGIPYYNQYGFLERSYMQDCKIYNADGSKFTFDAYRHFPINPVNGNTFFQYKQGGKWGIFTIDYKGRQTGIEAINPKTLQAVQRLPAVYDAIEYLRMIGGVPIFKLYKNGVTYTDTSWKPSARYPVPFIDGPFQYFKNGNRLQAGSDVTEGRAATNYSIVVSSPDGKIVYERQFPPKAFCSDFGIVNDSTIIYRRDGQGAFILLDIKHHNESTYWPSKSTIHYSILDGQVVAVQGSTDGLNLHLFNPLQLVTIPSAGPPDPDIAVVNLLPGRSRHVYLPDPSKKVMIAIHFAVAGEYYDTFFNDCLFLLDKKGNFAGVIDKDGVVYQ